MGRNRKPRERRHLLPFETRHFEERAFHVWCRGIDDMHVFPEDRDKSKFLEIFERHLSPREIRDANYRPYPKYFEDVELFGANVLDNHYHLLARQIAQGGLERLMRSALTGYGHYFNKTHGRQAQIFESPYSVRAISDDDDLRNMLSYVHGNNEAVGLDYQFSTHRSYLGIEPRDFIAVEFGLSHFESIAEYDRAMHEGFERQSALKRERRAQATPAPHRKIRRGPGSHLT